MKQRSIRVGDELTDDTAVVVRGGDLDPEILRDDALRNHQIYGTYGISVFAARDLTLDELAQQAPWSGSSAWPSSPSARCSPRPRLAFTDVIGNHAGDAGCQLIVGVESGDVPADLGDEAPAVLSVARLGVDRMAGLRTAVEHQAVAVSAAPCDVVLAETGAGNRHQREQLLGRLDALDGHPIA